MVLVGKAEEKRSLGKPRRSWEDFMKMDLQEVGYKGMDCTDVARHRIRWRKIVNAVMNIRVPLNVGNFLTSREPVSFSRRTLLHEVSE
jgi:hypothetical protein